MTADPLPGSNLSSLAAAGPTPAYPDKMAEFGRFVGLWDVEVTWWAPDGTVLKRRPGEWEFAWALEGRAIVDVWQVPPRSERDPAALDAPGECGMTVRFYDPRIGAWRSTWHGPVGGYVLPFIARRIAEEMVLEREEAGTITRWIFSDIEPDRFHWRSVASEDGGASWRLDQSMEAVRRHGRPGPAPSMSLNPGRT